MITITLQGEPPSNNHIYRSACRGRFPTTYLTHEGREQKADYTLQAKWQYKGQPLSGDIILTAAVYFKTKRKRDLDNTMKLVQDALNDVLWEDDSQIADLHLIRRYDPEDPRIVLSVDHLPA